jgi:hypothetical protein
VFNVSALFASWPSFKFNPMIGARALLVHTINGSFEHLPGVVILESSEA